MGIWKAIKKLWVDFRRTPAAFTGECSRPDDYPPTSPVYKHEEVEQPMISYIGGNQVGFKIADRIFMLEADPGHPEGCTCGFPYRPSSIVWWENFFDGDGEYKGCGDTRRVLMMEGKR